MTRLFWDNSGYRICETGLDRVVLYFINPETHEYDLGVAWNGVTSIQESDSGYNVVPIYADNIKYLNLLSPSQLHLTLEAFTYPDCFDILDGTADLVQGAKITQQKRQYFGLSYRTLLCDDIHGNDAGYKIHLIYGCLATPTDRAYTTVNDNPEANTFSWDIETNSVKVGNWKPVSQIIIDSRGVNPKKLSNLQYLLYGIGEIEPRLPLPDEILSILEIKPMTIRPLDPNEIIGHIETSEVQEDVVVTTSSITGTVKPHSWLFDSFSFEIGITTGLHYYLALDFSDNDFEVIDTCMVGVRYNDMHDVFIREDKKILLEIDEEHTILYVVLKDLKGTYTQMLNLSKIVFTP